MLVPEASPTECNVCQEEFDDEARCPRIFDCFHTLCNTCVAKLIKNNTKQCPFCRKHFNATTPKDVTVNHSTLELIKYISLREAKAKEPKKDQSVFQPKWVKDMKDEAKKMSNHCINECQETQKQIEKTISEITDLKASINQENIRIENEVCEKFYTVIARNIKQAEDLDMTIRKLQNQSKDLVDRNKTLEALKGKLQLCASETFKDTAGLLDEAMIVNNATGEWVRKVKDAVSVEGMMLELSQEKLKRRKENIDTILKSLDMDIAKDENSDASEGFWKGSFPTDDAINHSKGNRSNPIKAPPFVLVMNPARHTPTEVPVRKRQGRSKRRK